MCNIVVVHLQWDWHVNPGSTKAQLLTVPRTGCNALLSYVYEPVLLPTQENACGGSK